MAYANTKTDALVSIAQVLLRLDGARATPANIALTVAKVSPLVEADGAECFDAIRELERRMIIGEPAR